jgi:hypothetical protein
MSNQVDEPDAAHVPTPEELLDDVLTDVSKHLRNLRSWMPLVRELSDTQRASSYIPQSTRAAIGAQHAAGRGGPQQAYATENHGIRSAAPGNMTSWALEVDVEMTLRHLVRFVVHRLPLLAGDVPANETTEQLIGRVRVMFMRIRDLRIATAVAVDLEVLAGTCQRVLFGEDRTELPSPCPYCGRRSLVVYLETGVIRCERPRDPSGRAPTCHCAGRHDVDDQPCACRTQARFEHHWLRDRSGNHPHSWQSLHRALIHHPKETP